MTKRDDNHTKNNIQRGKLNMKDSDKEIFELTEKRNFSCKQDENQPLNNFSDILPSKIELREAAFVLDFSTENNTEQCVMNFLSTLGFLMKSKGTDYFLYIIADCVNKNYIPDFAREFYEITAEHFKVNNKNVEIAMLRALEIAENSGRINKMNEIFNCDVVTNGHLSNGDFLFTVTKRFVMIKKHYYSKRTQQ